MTETKLLPGDEEKYTCLECDPTVIFTSWEAFERHITVLHDEPGMADVLAWIEKHQSEGK